MDREKLTESADIASDNAVFESHPWNVFNDGFIKGAEWLMGQPLSERLTEDEREKIKNVYNQAVGDTKGYYSDTWDAAYAIIEFCEEIFGKEMFENNENN